VLLHAGYLVDISRWAGVDVHWFAPVFWTLAYEFQFYIAAALAFPLLSSKRRDVRLASFAAFLGLQVIGSGPFVYQFADMFLLGIVIFQRRAGLSGMREFAGLAVAATACIAWRYPSFIVYAPLLCALMLRIEIRSAVTRFAGDISYSVYLYHETFGLWLVGALVTVAKLPAAGAFLLAIVGAIAFAAVMHMLVERPALNASRALRNWRPFATPSRPTASSESPLR
jgi:peptidoglycan/LPS O-acetylase OafA/YrhL